MSCITSTSVDTPHDGYDEVEHLSWSVLPHHAQTLEQSTYEGHTDAPIIPPDVARKLCARVHSSENKDEGNNL